MPKDHIHEVIKLTMNCKEIKAIHKNIRTNYYKDFGWTTGGCFAFAEAITAILPDSELWVVGSKCEDDWASEHAIVKYKNKFYDATGLVTEKYLLANYSKKNKEVKLGKAKDWIAQEYPNELWYPQQEFVTENEIKLIGKTFFSTLRNYENNRNRI